MRAAFESILRLFVRTFDAKLLWFRSKIACFCVRFGAILARKTRASTAKDAQSSLAVVAHFLEVTFDQKVDRAMRSARKIEKTFHENRTRFRWFLQSFGVRQARRECATHSEVVFDMLEMM